MMDRWARRARVPAPQPEHRHRASSAPTLACPTWLTARSELGGAAHRREAIRLAGSDGGLAIARDAASSDGARLSLRPAAETGRPRGGSSAPPYGPTLRRVAAEMGAIPVDRRLVDSGALAPIDDLAPALLTVATRSHRRRREYSAPLPARAGRAPSRSSARWATPTRRSTRSLWARSSWCSQSSALCPLRGVIPLGAVVIPESLLAGARSGLIGAQHRPNELTDGLGVAVSSATVVSPFWPRPGEASARFWPRPRPLVVGAARGRRRPVRHVTVRAGAISAPACQFHAPPRGWRRGAVATGGATSALGAPPRAARSRRWGRALGYLSRWRALGLPASPTPGDSPKPFRDVSSRARRRCRERCRRAWRASRTPREPRPGRCAALFEPGDAGRGGGDRDQPMPIALLDAVRHRPGGPSGRWSRLPLC